MAIRSEYGGSPCMKLFRFHIRTHYLSPDTDRPQLTIDNLPGQ